MCERTFPSVHLHSQSFRPLCLLTMAQSIPTASDARASLGLSPMYRVSSQGTSKRDIPRRIGSGLGLCRGVSS